jgi:hypothetical protein
VAVRLIVLLMGSSATYTWVEKTTRDAVEGPDIGRQGHTEGKRDEDDGDGAWG